MSELLAQARTLWAPDARELARDQRRDLEQVFVESLTFAPATEIVDMLQQMFEEEWGALPVWARNLAFRLACLQRPGDPALLRSAAYDLLAFGPDWDDVAHDLEREAEKLEARRTS